MLKSKAAANESALLRQVNSMSRGLGLHGPWLGLSDDVIGQFEEARSHFQQADAAYAAARQATKWNQHRAWLAQRAVRGWLGKARLVVMLARGARWSEHWLETGFTTRKIPQRPASQLAVARTLVSFFARHPEFKVEFAEVTAASGRAICERFVQSDEMRRIAADECRQLKHQRDQRALQSGKALRRIARLVRQRLEGSDARLLEFGLAMQQVSRGRKRQRHVVNGRSDISVLPGARVTGNAEAA